VTGIPEEALLRSLAPLPGEVEHRMGIEPISELLARRDRLVRDGARLRARHGPFGTWDSERKMVLEKGAAVIRARAAARGTKITESQIESEKHTADEYVAFLTESLSEKSDWLILENEIQSINDLVNRGQAISRYLAAEIALTPR